MFRTNINPNVYQKTPNTDMTLSSRMDKVSTSFAMLKRTMNVLKTFAVVTVSLQWTSASMSKRGTLHFTQLKVNSYEPRKVVKYPSYHLVLGQRAVHTSKDVVVLCHTFHSNSREINVADPSARVTRILFQNSTYLVLRLLVNHCHFLSTSKIANK